MDLGLKNKTAVVLAASKGLGRGTAEALAAEGCNLAICSRNAENIEKTASELEDKFGVQVFYQAFDVKDKGALNAFFQEAAAILGGIDILVTNAGGPPVKSFEETTDEEWHEWFDITFMSVTRSIKTALPFMKKKGWGRIINITSVSVKSPVEKLIYSNALRLAVIGLAKSLSQELGPFGITVNNVAPGYHLTDGLERIITNKVQSGMQREEVLEQWISSMSIKRIGKPEDLADIITFLASEKAGFITGITLQVDGGLYKGTL